MNDIQREASGQDPNSLVGRPVVYMDTELSVPPPGHTYDVYETREEGPAYAAICNPGADGQLYVVQLKGNDLLNPIELQDSDEPDSFSTHTACTQNERDHNGTFAPINFEYSINPSGRQPQLSLNESILGMKAGFNNSLTTNNSCNYADATNYTSTLISTNSTRGHSIDGHSTMSWQTMSAVASTIRDTSGVFVVEADIRYNRDYESLHFVRNHVYL